MKCIACLCLVLALVSAVCGFTEEEIQKILDAHNTVRDNVPADFPKHAPSSCLPHLEWDTYLADMAQKYSNTCPTDHSEKKDRKYTDGTYVGENLYWDSASVDVSTLFERAVIDYWYKTEYEDYDYGGSTTGVGHYTQIVWNKTIRVGCGLTAHCPPDSALYLEHNAITCNYWPGGNIKGQAAWEEKAKGEKAAKCSSTTVKPFVSLATLALVFTFMLL